MQHYEQVQKLHKFFSLVNRLHETRVKLDSVDVHCSAACDEEHKFTSYMQHYEQLQKQQEVLEFLGLEDDGRDDFPVVNPSRATQSRLLTHLTHKPSEFRQKWGSRIRNALNVDSLGVSKVLYAINSREKGRAPTGLSLENEIREQYRSEIELLSREFGGDTLRHVFLMPESRPKWSSDSLRCAPRFRSFFLVIRASTRPVIRLL